MRVSIFVLFFSLLYCFALPCCCLLFFPRVIRMIKQDITRKKMNFLNHEQSICRHWIGLKMFKMEKKIKNFGEHRLTPQAYFPQYLSFNWMGIYITPHRGIRSRNCIVSFWFWIHTAATNKKSKSKLDFFPSVNTRQLMFTLN